MCFVSLFALSRKKLVYKTTNHQHLQPMCALSPLFCPQVELLTETNTASSPTALDYIIIEGILHKNILKFFNLELSRLLM